MSISVTRAVKIKAKSNQRHNMLSNKTKPPLINIHVQTRVVTNVNCNRVEQQVHKFGK